MTFHLLIISHPDNLAEAFSVRRTVFIEEQKVPEAIELDQYDYMKTTRHVLLLDESQQAIGTARFRPYRDDILKIERVAVLGHLRGSGAGRLIIEAIIEEAKKAGYHSIKLGAQLQARGFYERLGFKAQGEEFVEAGIRHLNMVKNIINK